MPLPLRIATASHPGRQRETNDDIVLVDEGLNLVLLADGGAAGAGAATAARAAVDAARDLLKSRRGDPVAALRAAFAAADGAVRACPDRGAGVSMLAARIDEARVLVVSVGVARAYLLRDAGGSSPPPPAMPRYVPPVTLRSGACLTCITKDHSSVCGLVERGHLEREQAGAHPLRNALTQALGGRDFAEPEVVAFEPQVGDRLLLCSDGLWGALGPSALATVLYDAGSTPAAAQALLGRALDTSVSGSMSAAVLEWPVAKPAFGGDDKPLGTKNVVERLGRDLSALAKSGELDAVIGREDELRRLAQILLQRRKANALLVGDSGVGKTCLVEGLAQRVMAPGIPASLQNRRIVEISVTSLVAGTKFRGEFEERMQEVVSVAEADPNLVLFIDEFHTVMGAGGAGDALDAANILKPALARGKIHVIGATTTAEFERYVARDDALMRRFEVVFIEEPTREEALAILEGLRPRFESHYGIRLTRESMTAAVDLGIRYMPERRLPDKALDVIDHACSQRLLSTLSPKAEGAEKSAAALAREDVARVVAERCRMPFELVAQDDAERVRTLRAKLEQRVLGQGTALDRIVAMVRAAYGGLKDPRRPVASFMFVGPTGVGKTEAARALAQALFQEDAIARFDMSEYMEKHQASRLIGAPPGYVGHEAEGLLTAAVKRRPASVILIDEVEKAHPDVLLLLLQILDEGVLTDARGRKSSFREAIVVLTSNIVVEGRKKVIGFASTEDKDQAAAARAWEDEARKELSRLLKPELVGRIGAIVPFSTLDPKAVAAIAEKVALEALQMVERGGRKVVLPETFVQRVLSRIASGTFGAREIERVVREELAKILPAEPEKGGPS
jgi:ATP-dependent Clp protease ATP-binding subunit ClpC